MLGVVRALEGEEVQERKKLVKVGNRGVIDISSSRRNPQAAPVTYGKLSDRDDKPVKADCLPF